MQSIKNSVDPVQKFSDNVGSGLIQNIIAGDARELAKNLVPNSVQSIITSPPYWGLRSYGAPNEIGAEPTFDEYLSNLSEVFEALYKSLKNDGTLWLVLGDTYTSGNRKYRTPDKKHSHRAMVSRPKTPHGLKQKDLIGLPWRVAFLLQSSGWFLRSEVIWHKTNPLPESVKDRPHQGHEHVFLLTKSAKYKFNYSALKECETERTRFTRSVWSIPVGKNSTGHAAPFPIDLVRPCVLSSTKEGDLVLDPFAGSGSVGLVCGSLNRNFVGFELINANAKLAQKRLTEKSSDVSQSVTCQSSLTTYQRACEVSDKILIPG